jgi:ABC-type oligopeptide transport system ATPase subunit
MPILELQHLKKYFSTQKAVDDISFKVDRGQRSLACWAQMERAKQR